MPLPVPEPGLVIAYAYLWGSKYKKGIEDGAKDRPCAIVLSSRTDEGETLFTVAPITHTQQSIRRRPRKSLRDQSNVSAWIWAVHGSS